MAHVHPEPRTHQLPSEPELEALFLSKHGPMENVGWAPRQRRRYGYYLPADVYEAFVAKAVVSGCSWIDIGGGHDIFPGNPALARALAARCSVSVAVDPSENVHRNTYVHERVQSLIEDYDTDRLFDLATLRMVAEHVVEPVKVVRALHRLLRPGGLAVVFTINSRSPLTLISRFTPFALHHPIKKVFWGGEEEDTFPVQYKMNSRKTLRRLFERQGLREVAFAYLDDLSTFGGFKYLNAVELSCWRVLRRLRLHYPENCLLGVYQKSGADS